jgi:hypothetical protein
MEAVAVILPVFAATAAVSVIWLARLSDHFWSWIESFNAVLGLSAAVITLFQVQTATYEARLETALSAARLNLSWVLTRTEYLMENCGVWWGDVLEDYEVANEKADAACVQRTHGVSTCAVCRIGHLVGQYRSLAFSPQSPEWNAENLHFNICEGQQDSFDLCGAISAYTSSAERVAALKSDRNPFAEAAGGPVAMWILQGLVAVFLGLQLGKTVHSRRKEAE